MAVLRLSIDYNRLTYVSKAGETSVRSIGDLAQQVLVATPEAALSYLRLQTSPRTFPSFRDPKQGYMLEVLSAQDFALPVFFGDVVLLRAWQKYMSNAYGAYGIVNESFFSKAQIRKTDCFRDGSRFVCKRTIFFCKRTNEPVSDCIFSVTQTVERNGLIKLVSCDPLHNKVVDSVTWFIPVPID